MHSIHTQRSHAGSSPALSRAGSRALQSPEKSVKYSIGAELSSLDSHGMHKRRLHPTIADALNSRWRHRVPPDTQKQAQAQVERSAVSSYAAQLMEERQRPLMVLAKEFAGQVLGTAPGEGDAELRKKANVQVKHTKRSKEAGARLGHRPEEVNSYFGHLLDANIPEQISVSGYNRRDLLALFMQFKALCALSSTPAGIDKATFKRAIPQLMVEDELFVDRVYAALDADGSGTIEWGEFIEAMSKLEKGSREERAEFMFDVYDVDKGGSVDREEMSEYFLSSLRVAEDEGEASLGSEIASFFVDRVFDTIAPGEEEIFRDVMLKYVRTHPEITDIYGMFGRSMLTFESVRRMLGEVKATPLLNRESVLDFRQHRSRLSTAQQQAVKERAKAKQEVAEWLRDKQLARATRAATRHSRGSSSRPLSGATSGTAGAGPSTARRPSDGLDTSSSDDDSDSALGISRRLHYSSPLSRQGSLTSMRLTSAAAAAKYAQAIKRNMEAKKEEKATIATRRARSRSTSKELL